jgi:glycosyltransferase involved in cell wall biosynthesis
VRATLLFVAPIVPAAAGNGLAMRAGVFLDALARDFAVTLLVIPVAGGASGASRFVLERARRAAVVPLDGALDPLWDLSSRVREPGARAAALAAYPRPALCRYATTPCIEALSQAAAGERFDVIHVMRSYLAPYLAPLLPVDAAAAPPWASLDLDDDEAATQRRLAALHERRGEPHDARIAVAEAGKFERHEAQWLTRFRLRIVCTPAHAGRIAAAYRRGVHAVVPNTVALAPPTPSGGARGRRILFVGNLSYLPNVDGISRFAREVLPRVRAALGAAVTLRIAGSAPAPEVAALAGLPGVVLTVDPADVAPCYADADLAVVPLDAGGGTRIKLLEAFAHGVPVVATAIGAEGIAAEPGVHLAIADSPAAFADACVRALTDVHWAAGLVERARELVALRYSHDVGAAAVRDAFRLGASLPPEAAR